MKYFIICIILVFFPLVEGESLAEVTCAASPAEDNRAGRKKVKKWDNCQGTQFHHYRKNKFKYDGFFIKGKRTGQGTEEVLSPNEFAGQIYIGEFKDGSYNGQGTLTLATGEKHVGEFKNHERNGQGKNTFPNGEYLEGYFKNDILINGFMDRTLDDGSHYVGEWKNGKGNGQGTHTLANGQKYVGEFKDGNYNGQGKITLLNGEFLEGYFEDILINGYMDNTLTDGSHYVGEYKNGKGNGQGTHTLVNGQNYVGEFKDNNYHGQGKFTWPNGEFLEGYFENSNLINGFMDRTYNGSHYAGEIKAGKKNGLGINTFPNGRVQEGFWKNDQFQYTQDIGSSPKIAQKKPDSNDSNSSKPYNQTPDDKEITASSGSGFAVSDDGYIITNNHVIDQCQSVVIHFEGEEIPATVVSYDTQNDLALLKGDFSPRTIFPLSNSRPELLQDVYVAGYPFGVQISSAIKVTKGIISSLTGIGNNFSNIQIDAALQSGNSGGPILDDLGNVVGVAVSKLDAKFMYENYGSIPENTNFGIKANVVKSILDSNNVAYPKSNAIDIQKSELARMITNGTYYLSCMMTMAQIKEMKTKKVLFENLN